MKEVARSVREERGEGVYHECQPDMFIKKPKYQLRYCGSIARNGACVDNKCDSLSFR